MCGNVADLAVGIVVGASFGKSVSSAGNDTILPSIGFSLGNAGFADLVLSPRAASEGGAAVEVRYSACVNSVLDFTIVAF